MHNLKLKNLGIKNWFRHVVHYFVDIDGYYLAGFANFCVNLGPLANATSPTSENVSDATLVR